MTRVTPGRNARRGCLAVALLAAAALPCVAQDALSTGPAAVVASPGPGDPPVSDAAGGASSSEWPCIQRRVGRISAGVVWSGPDPAQAGAWDKDFDAAALAQKLASRRTAIDDVDGLLDDFADRLAPTEKSQRLTHVFAGVLELVNAERDRVVQGIGRYARGQTKLAERVRLEADQLGDASDSPNPPETKQIQDLQTALKWDKRIFEERSRSLTYVCETPVLLERRVFDIARRIQQRLPS